MLKKSCSDGYDVILLSFCYGHVQDDDFILSTVEEAAQNNKGLVFLHCSLHNFRSADVGTSAWREMMRLTSFGHDKLATVVCENTAPEFPIMIGFSQAYEFPVEEVYLITEVQKTAKELVGALGEKTKTFHPIIWTNEFKGCKVFGTSIGHSTVTYSDEQYLDLVSSGLLWTDDRLQD